MRWISITTYIESKSTACYKLIKGEVSWVNVKIKKYDENQAVKKGWKVSDDIMFTNRNNDNCERRHVFCFVFVCFPPMLIKHLRIRLKS